MFPTKSPLTENMQQEHIETQLQLHAKKVKERCFKIPPSPHLPEFYLGDEFAFTRVGVDCADPIFVKNVFGKDRGMYKSYVALFTCASTRGLHLKLVPDLSSPSFIRALACLKARRSNSLLIVSDDGNMSPSQHHFPALKVRRTQEISYQ